MGGPQPAQIVQHDARGLDGTRGATAATAIPASKQVARSTPGAITTARRSVRPTPSRTRSPASPVHRRRQRPASDQRPIVSEQSRALGLADNGLKPPPARQNQGLGDGRREITKAASAQRRTRNSSIKLYLTRQSSENEANRDGTGAINRTWMKEKFDRIKGTSKNQLSKEFVLKPGLMRE